jgi:hypothetical protein
MGGEFKFKYLIGKHITNIKGLCTIWLTIWFVSSQMLNVGWIKFLSY